MLSMTVTIKSSRSQPSEMMRGRPSLDVDDVAPDSPNLTDYDERHMAIYLLLLDAEGEGDNWRDAANVILNIDPSAEPRQARRAWETHLGVARESVPRYTLSGMILRTGPESNFAVQG